MACYLVKTLEPINNAKIPKLVQVVPKWHHNKSAHRYRSTIVLVTNPPSHNSPKTHIKTFISQYNQATMKFTVDIGLGIAAGLAPMPF